MGLVDRMAESEPTHRIVTRRPAGVNDWDETGWIGVENRVVDVVMRYGDAVHFRLPSDVAGLERLRSELEELDGSENVFTPSGREYRADLPDDGTTVRSALAVDPGDTEAWLDRTFRIEEFAVVAGSDWLYRSVPHHSHVREVNAASDGELDGAIAAELDSIPRSGIVPIDGLVSWRAGGDEHQLTWDVLRRRERAENGRWATFDLEALRRVRPDWDQLAIEVRWRSPGSWPGRLVDRVRRSLSTEPPSRIEFPSSDVMGDALDSLRTLKTDLGYRFSIERE